MTNNNTAEEYLKSRNIIIEGFSEFWIAFPDNTKIELTEVLESYHKAKTKEILDRFTDEEINIFFDMSYHPSALFTNRHKDFQNGAKSILEELRKGIE